MNRSCGCAVSFTLSRALEMPAFTGFGIRNVMSVHFGKDTSTTIFDGGLECFGIWFRVVQIIPCVLVGIDPYYNDMQLRGNCIGAGC